MSILDCIFQLCCGLFSLWKGVRIYRFIYWNRKCCFYFSPFILSVDLFVCPFLVPLPIEFYVFYVFLKDFNRVNIPNCVYTARFILFWVPIPFFLLREGRMEGSTPDMQVCIIFIGKCLLELSCFLPVSFNGLY